MKRLRWTPAAAADLEHIRNYLDRNHPHLAQRTIVEIYERIKSLKHFPQVGRKGGEEGTRELVMQSMPYIIVFRERQQAIEILRIWHTAQQRH